MADGFNSLEEQYEQNNFIFFTAADKQPLVIMDGEIQNVSKDNQENIVHCGVMKEKQPNAYSLDEIKSLMKYQKRTGKMQEKAIENQAKIRKLAKAKRTVRAKLPRIMK